MTEHKNREACQLEGYNVRYDPDFNRRYQSSKVENIKTLIQWILSDFALELLSSQRRKFTLNYTDSIEMHFVCNRLLVQTKMHLQEMRIAANCAEWVILNKEVS